MIMLMDRIQDGRGHSQLRTKREELIARPQARRGVAMAQKVLDALTAKFAARGRAHRRRSTATRSRGSSATTSSRSRPGCATIRRWRSTRRCSSPRSIGSTGNPSALPLVGALGREQAALRGLLPAALAEAPPPHPPQDRGARAATRACPSLAELWPAFNWQERETFDMYGIRFDGHPDLRRIYLYEEFVGYPLRKDYPKEKRQPLVRRDDLPINPIKRGAHANGDDRHAQAARPRPQGRPGPRRTPRPSCRRI